MDYFEKRQWIRIVVCAVLVAAAVLAMTGVFTGQGVVYDPSASNGAAAEASEKGFGGEVTAHVTLENGTVKDLAVDTPDETDGLGKRASEAEFTDQFIGKAGPFAFGEDGIEALSGATVTSEAALKAINRAITGEEAAPAEETKAEAAEAPAAEATEAPAADPDAATYQAEKANDYGTVTVIATAKDGKLTDVQIQSAGDYDLLTDKIRTEWAQAILESGSAAPDAMTSASLKYSAKSVTAAMTEILDQISGTGAGEAGEAPAADPDAATYQAEKANDYGTVTVIATVKDGKLTDVQIQSAGDYDLLTDKIRTEWAQAILESGSAAPDAITGASLKYSAKSVTEAMTEILEKMSGN